MSSSGSRQGRVRMWAMGYGLVVGGLVLTAGPVVGADSVASGDPGASAAAVTALKAYLQQPADGRGGLAEQRFAHTPLARTDAGRARERLWQDRVRRIRSERAAEMEARELVDGNLKMRFYYRIFGEKPASGRSLYISMHGGGGAPARVNDGQWENQKRLYQLEEGVYLVPRAPTDTWNLWHQAHIDRFFARLIEDLVVFEDVDPDRVYILGYSAGGDGVFQLAPRMADRLAAAAMMAGHPNETSPLGLRNLPFTMHVGGQDGAYQRNEIARRWETQLGDLHAADPDGYVHWVKIYPDKGHWLDREDAAAIPWMAKYTRNRYPTRVVWKQDDVRHSRFYWLAADLDQMPDRAAVIATRQDQKIDIQAEGVQRLTILLADEMLDLDQPVRVTAKGTVVYDAPVPRTIAVLGRTLAERGDPRDAFSAQVTVDLP